MKDLFPKPPRRRPRVLMHVIDAGYADKWVWARFRCGKCGTETEWLTVDTVAEAKRGLPCERCNVV